MCTRNTILSINLYFPRFHRLFWNNILHNFDLFSISNFHLWTMAINHMLMRSIRSTSNKSWSASMTWLLILEKLIMWKEFCYADFFFFFNFIEHSVCFAELVRVIQTCPGLSLLIYLHSISPFPCSIQSL